MQTVSGGESGGVVMVVVVWLTFLLAADLLESESSVSRDRGRARFWTKKVFKGKDL